jgi:hypothetical protein
VTCRGSTWDLVHRNVSSALAEEGGEKGRKPTEIDDVSKVLPEALWHDDSCQTSLRVIDEEQRDRSDERDRDLVSPADVKDIVEEAKEGCRQEREES